jgi:shikimate kinase
MNQGITKITLLGYMGSGKSTVARILGEKLELKVIDLDDYISEKEGLGIPEIFETHGEIYFRKIENAYLLELLNSNEHFVLALGGGTPCYANNMDAILEHSDSYYLKASIGTLSERLIKEKDHRPLIASLSEEQLTEFIAKHLFERRNFYEMAGTTIQIDGKTPEQIASEIYHSK